MLEISRGRLRLHYIIFAAIIGSSSTSALAQDVSSEDCELAVAAMINLAQTNLANNEAMLQLSLDKLGILTALDGQANADCPGSAPMGPNRLI